VDVFFPTLSSHPGRYINRESYREAKPLLYNDSPFSLIRGRGMGSPNKYLGSGEDINWQIDLIEGHC
jgi:hypothetical protein